MRKDWWDFVFLSIKAEFTALIIVSLECLWRIRERTDRRRTQWSDLMRLWCKNPAVAESGLRGPHDDFGLTWIPSVCFWPKTRSDASQLIWTHQSVFCSLSCHLNPSHALVHLLYPISHFPIVFVWKYCEVIITSARGGAGPMFL